MEQQAHLTQFSKYATQYDNHNIIQRIISKAIVRECISKPANILELGCGSGQIYRHISWKIQSYTAVDFSSSMCKLHPKNDKITVKCLDFDSDEFYDLIKNNFYDVVFSASALQWSKDLSKLLLRLEKSTTKINFAIFTANTFKEIYNITKQTPPILSKEEILKAFEPYNVTTEILTYELRFNSKKELFRYIKNSGVKGEVALSYKEAKQLYKQYNYLYLSFEVIFIKGTLVKNENS